MATIGGLAGLVVIPFVGRYYDLRFREDPAQALRLIGLLTLPAALFTPVQYFMPNPVLFTIASIPQVVLLTVGVHHDRSVAADDRSLPAARPRCGAWARSTSSSSAPPVAALIALPLTNAYGPRTDDPA